MTEGSGRVNLFVPGLATVSTRVASAMRNRFTIISLVLVAGCAPLSLFYREGASVDRMHRDLASCRIEAIKAVPVDQDTRIIPGSEFPQILCDSNGVCHSVWVQVTPLRIETYDANEGLRNDYTRQCMGKLGYQPVRLPQCEESVVRATRLEPTRVLPPLSAQSCAIRLNTGQWQVVTP